MNWTQTTLHTALQRVLRAPFDSSYEDIHAPEHQEAWKELEHSVNHVSEALPESVMERVHLMLLWGEFRHQNDHPTWSHRAWARGKDLGLSKASRRLSLSIIDQWSNVYRALNEQFPGDWPAHQRARHDLWCALIGCDLGRAMTTRMATHVNVWIELPQGMSSLPLQRVIESSCWHPFQDKTQPEDKGRVDVLQLPVDDEAQRALLKTLKARNTRTLTVIERVHRALPATLEAITDLLDGNAQHRVFFVSTHAPASLIETHGLSIEGLQRMSTLHVRLPGLAEQFEHAPQARTWWLDRMHQKHLHGPMSSGALEYVEERIDQTLGRHYTWPGNELELARNLLRCAMTNEVAPPLQTSGVREQDSSLAQAMSQGNITVKELTRKYCQILYTQHGTYEAVSKHTGLDRRTVKKYLTEEISS